jgi:pimeloyl-ACP methyl ester carboxylesterase
MIRLEDWWSEGRFVPLDGHRIYTRDQGTGPTLVFLHGFPSSSHDWAPVISDLASDYRCVTFDYLGYGASDKPADADYSSIQQTTRALRVLESLGVEQARFVAHDLGGILLQQILYRAAEGTADIAIAQAVFANSSVFAELYRPTPMQLALVDPAQGKALARQISRETLLASLATLFPSHPPTAEVLEDLWTAISRGDGQHLWPEHLVYMAERAEQGGGWVDAMRSAGYPVGFIYGLADPISGEQILARAQHELPTARCVGLPGLGHYPQVEGPAAFTQALRDVLARPVRP